jgi:hypothetical protein
MPLLVETEAPVNDKRGPGVDVVGMVIDVETPSGELAGTGPPALDVDTGLAPDCKEEVMERTGRVTALLCVEEEIRWLVLLEAALVVGPGVVVVGRNQHCDILTAPWSENAPAGQEVHDSFPSDDLKVAFGHNSHRP